MSGRIDHHFETKEITKMRNNILNLLPFTGKQIFSRLTFTFLIAAQSIAARNVEITQFGAVGDAATLNTKALQMAIDTCAKTGGGEVTVPPGTYITGTIYLRSNVELHLCRGSIIRGSYRNPEEIGRASCRERV